MTAAVWESTTFDALKPGDYVRLTHAPSGDVAHAEVRDGNGCIVFYGRLDYTYLEDWTGVEIASNVERWGSGLGSPMATGTPVANGATDWESLAPIERIDVMFGAAEAQILGDAPEGRTA